MESGDSAPPYFAELNQQQLEAAKAVEGPVLIVAGAGTGKTRTLTSRMAYIIDCGLAEPHHILAVTFTNKAANELKERVANVTGVDPALLNWVGTFHSMCARILRVEAERVGLEPNFTIYDTDDQLRTVKRLLKAQNITVQDLPPRHFAHQLDVWKNDGLLPADLDRAEQARFEGRAVELYTSYQEQLLYANAADFGDLILHVVNLFATNDDVLQKYQNLLRYMLVDEYQDTNIAQYKWLRLLALGHSNICCVGDDDQAIYSWRGARPRIMLEFENHFPGARIIKLEHNYRSTSHILGAAVGLVRHNIDRHSKVLKPAVPDDGQARQVDIVSVGNERSEAGFVARSIGSLLGKGGSPAICSGSDIAVAARTWARLAEIEQEMVRHEISYRVIGGPRFYDRKEIRDAMGYLRLCNNERDNAAFERVVNFPARGIGIASMNEIRSYAANRRISLMESARQLADSPETSRRLARAIGRFAGLITSWTRNFSTAPEKADTSPSSTRGQPARLDTLVGDLLEECGLIDFFQRTDSDESRMRVENLDKFAEIAGRHASLDHFLTDVGLKNQDAQEAVGDRQKQVSLMTLHAAKGSEYEAMFLVGWEDGQLPSSRSLAREQELKQLSRRTCRTVEKIVKLPMHPTSAEIASVRAAISRDFRKLSYVAVDESSSVDRLYEEVLSWGSQPRPHDLKRSRKMAWNLLGLEALEEERRLAHVGITRAKRYCVISSALAVSRFNQVQVATKSRFLGELPARHVKHWRGSHTFVKARQPRAVVNLAIGKKVKHKTFGTGKVIADGNKYSTVKFDSGETKTLLNSYLSDSPSTASQNGQIVRRN